MDFFFVFLNPYTLFFFRRRFSDMRHPRPQERSRRSSPPPPPARGAGGNDRQSALLTSRDNRNRRGGGNPTEYTALGVSRETIINGSYADYVRERMVRNALGYQHGGPPASTILSPIMGATVAYPSVRFCFLIFIFLISHLSSLLAIS